MMGSQEYLMDASRANLQTSLALASRSIEEAAQLVRRQLNVAATLTEEGVQTLRAVAEHGDYPVTQLAERQDAYERQLQKILDLSCQCLEVTARAQAEMVRLMEDNLQNMDEAVHLKQA
jgi:predicted urease superfamily metal-dependent hydrolase